MAVFYGRSLIRERANVLVEHACSGVGSVLLFRGEPGIGKSHAAEYVAAQARALGATVAMGRSWEAGGAPAYWPWIQVFRDLGMDEDPFSDVAAELHVGGPEARFAAFDRAVRALRARAAQRPLVLVLDDLHAADAPSLQLLLLLARQVARARLLVVGAYRDAELELQPGIAPLLAAIAREAEVLPLQRLQPSDVAEWLRDVEPHARAGDGAQLLQLTEGHPLFVVEALRLGQTGELNAWSLVRGGVLDERLGQLTAATRSQLSAAAVFGREFSSADLVALAAPSASGATPTAAEREVSPVFAADAVHSALREALAASIVLPGREPQSYRFSHVLLRDRLYAELQPSAREQLHARAGSVLLARGGDIQAAVFQLFAAGGAVAPEQTAELAVRAARAALQRLGFEQAIEIGRRALRGPRAHTLSTAHVCSLELLVAEALFRSGDAAEALALCTRAAERAERTGELELLARAALVYGTELNSGQVDPQMVSLLRKAEAALPEVDSSLRARVLTRLAASLTPPLKAADGLEALALMREALAMARRLGDAHALLYVLQFAATVGMVVPERERFAMLEESIGLARALKQPLMLAHALPNYVTALLGLGERDRAEAALPELTEVVRALDLPLARLRCSLVQALLASLRDDYAAADSLGEQSLQLARELDSPAGLSLVLTHRLGQAQLRGDPQLLLPLAPTLLARMGSLPGAGPHIAWFLAGVGRVAEARERLAPYIESPETFAELNLWELAGVGGTCVLLRDLELAPRVYGKLQRATDRMFWNMAPGTIVGPFSRVLGDLAALLGKGAEARQHYEKAGAFLLQLGATALAEQCQLAAARPVTDAGESTGRDVRVPAALGRASAAASSEALQLQREGELWTLTSAAGSCVRLKHSKGLGYLQRLLENPGQEIHVLALAGIEQHTGDAGPVLDMHAKAAYRQRLQELREELSEAERFSDRGRRERAQSELDALSEQLAGAVGLGGRDRRAASDVERTRVNVQRRLKDVFDRVAAADPELGRYLAAAVRTGTTCVYMPF